MSLFVEAVPDRPWPLHPRPSEWEDLETWVRRIAKAYGVSYDAFLLNALDHKGSGSRDLDHAPIQVLARLSVGTGVPTERLLDMTTRQIMGRMVQWRWEEREPPLDQAASDNLDAMASRQRRRMSANRGF